MIPGGEPRRFQKLGWVKPTVTPVDPVLRLAPPIQPTEESMTMKHYRVMTTIQSPNIDDNAPVEVQWYAGHNGIKALAALAQAAAHDEDTDHGDLPASVRYRTLSVSMTIEDWVHEGEENMREGGMIVGEEHTHSAGDTCPGYEGDADDPDVPASCKHH